MKLAYALVPLVLLMYPGAQAFAQKVEFQATYRLSDADGVAEIRRHSGTTHIEIRLDNMKPAAFFGGDYATYVLWLVAPGGKASNLGEFRLNGDESRLSATTDLKEFAMMVTAEPHFLVSAPSRFVVMEDTP